MHEAIRRLTADRLLDDRRADGQHARTASRIKGRGRLRILRELEARGLDRAIAQEAVSALPDADEAAALTRLLARKRLPHPLPAADRRRLFEQLLRRGFPTEVIRKALRTRGDED